MQILLIGEGSDGSIFRGGGPCFHWPSRSGWILSDSGFHVPIPSLVSLWFPKIELP